MTTQRFEIVTGKRTASSHGRLRPRLHLLRLDLPPTHPPVVGFDSWQAPVRLLRKDQMEDLVTEELKQRRKDAGLPEEEMQEVGKKSTKKRRKGLDTAMLAPNAQSWHRNNLFEKKTRRVFPVGDLKDRRRREQKARDALPWVLEDDVAWQERILDKEEEAAIKKAEKAKEPIPERAPRPSLSGPWRSYEGRVALEAEGSRYAVLAIQDGKFVMQVVDKRYEFKPRPRHKPLDAEVANKLIMATATSTTKKGKTVAGSTTRGVNLTTSLQERFGLGEAARRNKVHAAMLASANVGLRLVNRGQDDDDDLFDDAFMSNDVDAAARQEMAIRNLLRAERRDMRGDVEEELDFDYQGEFQDDEETGVLAGAGEEVIEGNLNEEEREIRRRMMKEYRLAEDDLFGSDEEDEVAAPKVRNVVTGDEASQLKAFKKKSKRKGKDLKKQEDEDDEDVSDSEVDPYAKRFGLKAGQDELESESEDEVIEPSAAQQPKPVPPKVVTEQQLALPSATPSPGQLKVAGKRPLPPTSPTTAAVEPTVDGYAMKRQRSLMSSLPPSRQGSVPLSREGSLSPAHLAHRAGSMSPKTMAGTASPKTEEVTHELVINILRSKSTITVSELVSELRRRCGVSKEQQKRIIAIIREVSTINKIKGEGDAPPVQYVVLKSEFA